MPILDFGGSASGLRTEISNELASTLAAVLDSSGDEGGRYDARTRRSLVQTIAARAYGKPLLELAYLIAAVDRLSGRHGYVGFFWGVQAATSGAFRAAVLGGSGAGQGTKGDRGRIGRADYQLSGAGVPGELRTHALSGRIAGLLCYRTRVCRA